MDSKIKIAFDGLWTEKYRPSSLEEIVLSKDDRDFFESLSKNKEIPHLLFAGVQGTGKTSLAKIIVKQILDCQYLYINASDENGIDAIRGKVMTFAKTKSLDGKIKVVLLDEADQISSDAQKALRNVIEEFASNTRFILTCNYLYKIISPLQSRCQIINLIPPVQESVQRIVTVLKQEKISIPETQKDLLLKHIQQCLPDLRRIINDIQKFSINGTLSIKNEGTFNFAQKVLKHVFKKTDLSDIRAFVIQNEKEFSSDYRLLQKQLFEAVFENQELTSEQKTSCMLILSESLYKDAIVIDKEINCFAGIISLYQFLN